jgi:AcrR family transcriptional regulator
MVVTSPKRKKVDRIFCFCYYTIQTVYFRWQKRELMSPRASSKESIIDAAEAVVLENGARHMTLDAVAARAGVSKGGLLYHFPSKDALLRAMLERLRKNMEDTREKKSKGLKKGPGREIKAYILSGADRDPRKDQIRSALLAAVAHDPKLLQSAREDFRRSLAEFMRSGLNFKRVAVIFFAVSGLVLSELLSLSPLSNKERHALVEELLRLAEE